MVILQWLFVGVGAPVIVLAIIGALAAIRRANNLEQRLAIQETTVRRLEGVDREIPRFDERISAQKEMLNEFRRADERLHEELKRMIASAQEIFRREVAAAKEDLRREVEKLNGTRKDT